MRTTVPPEGPPAGFAAPERTEPATPGTAHITRPALDGHRSFPPRAPRFVGKA